MDANTTEVVIKACLTAMRQRLDDATSVARAAQACVDAGNTEKGLEIALDVEPAVHEASTLLNAALLLKRIADD